MINLTKKYLLNKTKSLTTQFLSAGGHNVNNIPSVCDFNISSAFDWMRYCRRYLPIFFLFCDITVIFDIYCDIAVFGNPNVPLVKFSVTAMSCVDRCCSYSLNNSSKSVKNKLHWLFISFWSACVTSLSLLSAILPSDKFSSPQTLSVETGQLGPNLLTRILSRWPWGDFYR